jgi:1-acyl-sn-glycerol-3-phosphate acyltransferase
MAKDELFHLPMLGPAIRWIGAFPVKRETADRAAIHAAVRVLRGNRALVMFPEGRLSESGLLGTVHPGAAMIAIRSGAPILPVALARTNSFLPYGHVVPQRSRLPARVFFGKPIHPSAVAHLRGRAATDELTRLLKTELSRLTGQSCGG